MALFLASFLGVEARKVKARVFFFFFPLHKAVFYFYFNNTSRVGSHDISFISFSDSAFADNGGDNATTAHSFLPAVPVFPVCGPG